MVLEKLGESLKNTISKIAGSLFIDERIVNELVKEMQRALLLSDVNVQLVFSITKTIKDRILKEDTPKALSKKEHLINIVYETLTDFLGKEPKEIVISKERPFVIMLAGLFGNGKTTTAQKLAKYYQKRGFKIAMLCTDTWRPAAFDQLLQLGKAINVPVYGNKAQKDPIKIFNQYKSDLFKADIVIIDTAGRDALSPELIKELNDLGKEVLAHERLIVMSADVGQAAQKQAEAFHTACDITGVIITKLDGTAKGGGALSACAATNAPVKFIGVGERVDDLEVFDPKRFVGRLLGMGDIETLLEKAKEAMSEDEAQDLGERFLKGDFTLIDLYQQMEAMNKMGPLGKVVEMIPGFSQLKLPKEALAVQQDKLTSWKFILDSCTKAELEKPEEIHADRVERIAKGSGCTVAQVRDLLKQYKQSKKVAKMFKGQKNMDKMMKQIQTGQVKMR